MGMDAAVTCVGNYNSDVIDCLSYDRSFYKV